MPSTIVINVELSNTLTASICSHLTIELFKHIAYQRQQIPFPYKQLATVLSRRSDLDHGPTVENQGLEDKLQNALPSRKTIQAQNEYHRVKGLFDCMQNAFLNLGNELNCEKGVVEEVAMVLGATPLSPRDVYRIQFPPVLHGHIESKHPHQSSLLELFRCLISSDELNSFINQPLSPTNMFLFFRKNSTFLATSGFFPKERYNIPTIGKHISIRLIPPTNPPRCICGGVNIFKDNESNSDESCLKSVGSEELEEPMVLCWFQALHALKGFKDVKINGVSASTVWLQSR